MKGPGKSLAVASLLLGLISLPTAGLAGIGALAGIVLGIASLVRARHQPGANNGGELAAAGIATSAISVVAAIPLALLVYTWHISPGLMRDFELR